MSQNLLPAHVNAYSLQGGHYVAVLDHCAVLRIVDDAVDEDNEQFKFDHIDPGPGSARGRTSLNPPFRSNPLVVTIIDNDPEPSLSIADAGGAEGADLEFTVTLDPASGREVTVDWAVDGDTATAGDDYTDGSGTLTFAPGDTTKTVTVATLPDTVPEGDETFTVTLSNASNAAIADCGCHRHDCGQRRRADGVGPERGHPGPALRERHDGVRWPAWPAPWKIPWSRRRRIPPGPPW